MYKKLISGWGNNTIEYCYDIQAKSEADLINLVKIKDHGVLARGGATSYGDASLNNGGAIIEMKSIKNAFIFDAAKGILTCSSGYMLNEILDRVLPHAWFFYVTPGTSNATIGGCIACDAHGKNWSADSFGSYISGLKLLLVNGQVLICNPNLNRELFFATIGGMGLTGIILEATLQLKKISSLFMNVESLKFSNINECFDIQEKSKGKFEYIYCWVDSLKEGKGLGRGIIQRANHYTLDNPSDEIAIKSAREWNVPVTTPFSLINKLTVKAFNSLYYGMHNPSHQIEPIINFFYPLDKIKSWNRLYGHKGFIEYQAAFPNLTYRNAINKMLKLVTASKYGSFMLGIKPIGKSAGMLSFPIPGYTIAIDFACTEKLDKLISQLDEIVIENNGRVYLSKDSTLKSDIFMQMYGEEVVKFEKTLNDYDIYRGQSSSLWKRVR